MTEVKTYCDHCGKVLDEMRDYCNIEMGYDTYFQADLCKSCYVELCNITKKFVKKGGAE